MSRQSERIDLSHGSGGLSMARLIDRYFVKAFDNSILAQKNDGAVLSISGEEIVLTTDSYVITPYFFPGGDIGSLSVHGTVNDLSMCGGRPLYLSCGFILEEGFLLDDLEKIVSSMAAAAREAGVQFVTGDTKVVPQGKADGIFINTTGIGQKIAGVNLSPQNVKLGDKILVNGSIGDHGVAIMSKRQNLGFESEILSDSASLNDLTFKMLMEVPDIKCLRDPTRGGISATLNEVAQGAKVDIELDEAAIPIKMEVRSACELLGLDPLFVANEGKLIAFCPESKANQLLKLMRSHPLGKNSAIIGEVVDYTQGFVEMKTTFGGSRLVQWISGEQLPRIC